MRLKIVGAVTGAMLLVVGLAWAAVGLGVGAGVKGAVPFATTTASPIASNTAYPGGVGTVCTADIVFGAANPQGKRDVTYTWSVRVLGGNAVPPGTYAFSGTRPGSTPVTASTATGSTKLSGNYDPDTQPGNRFNATFTYTPIGANPVYRACTVTEGNDF